MKIVYGLLALLIVSLLVQSVDAISAPDTSKFETRPRTLSPNTGFIMYMDNPVDWTGSVRLEWDIKSPSNCVENDYNKPNMGQFPRVGDRWLCYFSNTDQDSSCGPSPFTGCLAGGSYTMGLIVVDSDGTAENKTVNITLSNIDLNTLITQQENAIQMKVCGVGTNLESVYFEAYTDDLEVAEDGYLTYDALGSLCHIGNITLDPGTYFISFEATEIGTTKTGGDLKKVVVVDNETPGVDNPVTVKGDIITTFEPKSIVLGQSTTGWNTKGSLFNKGSQAYGNLSIVIPDDLRSYMVATPDEDTILVNQTIDFTITLAGITTGMSIVTNLKLYSLNELIAYIPIQIAITKLGSGGEPEIVYITSDSVGITPYPVITGTFPLGIPLERTFTITNNGNEAMQVADFEFDKDSSLSSANVDVTFPTTTIAPEGLGSVRIKLNPLSARSYAGKITLTTTVGTKFVYVDVTFEDDDISAEIQNARDDLTSLTENRMSEKQKFELMAEIASIENKLDDAEAATSLDISKQLLNEANGMIIILEDVYYLVDDTETPNGEFDLMSLLIPIIVVVVVIIVLLAVYTFIKRRQESGGDENFEETSTDFEEDDFQEE